MMWGRARVVCQSAGDRSNEQFVCQSERLVTYGAQSVIAVFEKDLCAM